MTQLTQVRLAQIVSSILSKAPTQNVHQTANNQPIAAAASTPAVQQVQTPMMFDVPVFEGDSTVKLVDMESKSCIPGQSMCL